MHSFCLTAQQCWCHVSCKHCVESESMIAWGLFDFDANFLHCSVQRTIHVSRRRYQTAQRLGREPQQSEPQQSEELCKCQHSGNDILLFKGCESTIYILLFKGYEASTGFILAKIASYRYSLLSSFAHPAWTGLCKRRRCILLFDMQGK